MVPSDPNTALLEYWRKFVAPIVYSFQALERDGIGVGFVTDAQLAAHELDGLSVLVIPADDLDGQQANAVSDFESQGGLVVKLDAAQYSHWNWHDNVLRSTVTIPEFLTELDHELANASVRLCNESQTELTHGFFEREQADGRKSLVIFVADDDSWLSTDLLSDEEKIGYVPPLLPDFELEIADIGIDEIIGINTLRYAHNFQSWGQRKISTSDVIDLGDRISIPINRDNSGASKHLRVIEIQYSTSEP